jgi:hypothetical protein
MLKLTIIAPFAQENEALIPRPYYRRYKVHTKFHVDRKLVQELKGDKTKRKNGFKGLNRRCSIIFRYRGTKKIVQVGWKTFGS